LDDLTTHYTYASCEYTQEKLVGILDQTNLLRYYTDQPSDSARTINEEHITVRERPGIVGEVTFSQVPCVSSGSPLPEVLRQVQETPLRRIMVIDSAGKAVDVIANSDILAASGAGNRRNPLFALAGRFALTIPEEVFRRRPGAGPMTAQQIMRPRLFAVTPTTSVPEAVRIMLAHHIKRLIVVDEAGKPLGLVDRQQLLRSLVKGGV
jgi:CBS domain-containing protein